MGLEKRKRNGDFEAWVSTPPIPTSASSSRAPPAPIPADIAAPPAKRPRTRKSKANPDEPPAEKRAARFKLHCPQAIMERVERVMSQRFFMVDRLRVPGELKEEFKVLGSTGNIYTVTIQQTPSCNCPDAMKGNHCKHILFIFLKVLQVTQASGSWYQKALLTSELESIFAEAPLAPNALANARVLDAYAKATGKSPSTSTSASKAKEKEKRLPGPDDDCPVCYESMHNVAEKQLVFCEECGNALHNECFGQWKTTLANQGKPLTCVWCRANWVTSGPAGGNRAGTGVRTASGGYINLSGVAGTSPVRDTSTYYHGPRRGQRYLGWNDYEDD